MIKNAKFTKEKKLNSLPQQQNPSVYLKQDDLFHFQQWRDFLHGDRYTNSKILYQTKKFIASILMSPKLHIPE